MRHRIRTVLLCASLLLVISLSLWLLREPLPWFRGPVFQISEDNLRAILLVSGDYGQRPLDTSEARQAVNLLNDFHTVKFNGAGGGGGQAHQQFAQRGFSAAGFAYDAQGLPAVNVQRNVVYCVQEATGHVKVFF